MKLNPYEPPAECDPSLGRWHWLDTFIVVVAGSIVGGAIGCFCFLVAFNIWVYLTKS